MPPTSTKHAFKPRARLLLLLGDQLIRDAGIAVFELVKNGYDADATEVRVSLLQPTSQEEAVVVVEDDGCGMTLQTVKDVWLEPGTDFRAAQKASSRPRTTRFARLPLGEKGVGRFATSKLGERVELVTRSRGEDEIVVSVDWAELAAHTYLAEARVVIRQRPPVVFTGRRTGTRLTVTGLREPWTRRQVRSLHRAMTSITSPFEAPDSFATSLSLEPDPGWLQGLPNAQEILAQALYKADGELSGTEYDFKYRFAPPPGEIGVPERRKRLRDTITAVPEPGGDQAVVDLAAAGVGSIKMNLRIFDLDARTLQSMALPTLAVRDFLKSNGGIRVYRDGVRVFDYGEPGNDWLDLGARRVNVPGARLSNNQVVGAVHLSLEESPGLVEKTNREGFVENRAYRALASAVLCAVENVTAERNTDKATLRIGTGKIREPVTDALATLRRKLSEQGRSDLDGDIDRIEREFRDSQERLVTAAGTGLQLMLVIHEVEKGVSELVRAVDRDVSTERLHALTTHLAELIEGLSYLTRKSGRAQEKASELIRQSLFNTEFRLRSHNISLTQEIAYDFRVRCTRRLVVATVMNLLDNSIYWSDVAGSTRSAKKRPKRIYIGTTLELGGKAIVVADNGPGFRDDPALLTQALISRRPDGTGIGLHLADQVMKAHGGALLFPDAGDAEVPEGHNGAVVALLFDPPKEI